MNPLAFQKVTLVAPDGREFVAEDPVTLNDMIYGRGYKPKAMKAETAIAKAADQHGDVRKSR